MSAFRFRAIAVLDGVLDTLAVEAGRQGPELIGWVDDDVPERLVGDPGRLRQVLVNLTGNAVKFTERGEVIVHLGWQENDGLLLGMVQDTGIGIAPEHRALIFDAFAQADSSMTRRYGGTGLGLAITQRLVGLMDGRIELESSPGEGSTFAFTARVGVAAPPPPPVRLIPVCASCCSFPRRSHRHSSTCFGAGRVGSAAPARSTS